ncbi:zinc finger protein 287 [Elysia marginata]|uniref:Zinc finger protein 287 n=1 Tax=Elysia marginata TaxID=1093978 RepID=A0AAV4EZ61_9GAST|nr:zinc finger protein 287 [Elysia marginata]
MEEDSTVDKRPKCVQLKLVEETPDVQELQIKEEILAGTIDYDATCSSNGRDWKLDVKQTVPWEYADTCSKPADVKSLFQEKKFREQNLLPGGGSIYPHYTVGSEASLPNYSKIKNEFCEPIDDSYLFQTKDSGREFKFSINKEEELCIARLRAHVEAYSSRFLTEHKQETETTEDVEEKEISPQSLVAGNESESEDLDHHQRFHEHAAERDGELGSSTESKNLQETLCHFTQRQFRCEESGKKSLSSNSSTENKVYCGDTYAKDMGFQTQRVGDLKRPRILDLGGDGLSSGPTKTLISVNWEELQQDSDGKGPFQCFWCSFEYFQREDWERHIQCSHRQEYAKLLEETYCKHLRGSQTVVIINSCSSKQFDSSLDCSSFEHQHVNLSGPIEKHNEKDGCLDVVKSEIEENKPFNLKSKNSHENFCKNTELNHNSRSLTDHTVINLNRNSKLQNKHKINEAVSTYDSSLEGYQNSASLSTYTGEKPYKCDFCGKKFSQRSNLTTHRRIHTDEKPFKCEVCGKRFRRSTYLITHERIHSGEKPFKCDVCGKGFSQSVSLVGHKRIHTGEKPYSCDVCDKRFAESSALTRHKRLHSSEKPYECDICGKWFSHSSDLSRHKQNHKREKPHKCDLCGKGFTCDSHLITHKRIHSGEKPFKCDVCGKGFCQSVGLYNHKRIHSGEKPYKCDVCGKAFIHSSDLSRHKRTHNGEKPHRCDICGKGFSHSGDLPRHKRTHNGEKPYKCDVCCKEFCYSHQLTYHKRTHSGEKPFSCDVCGKRFSHSSNLTTHKRIHSDDKLALQV